MIFTPPLSAKKPKIVLSDYPFQQDLEHRRAMLHFTPNDIALLSTLLDQPSQARIEDLVEDSGLSQDAFQNSLEKLSRVGLVARHHESIIIDKVLRKYYETQLLRFSQHTYPSIDLFHHQLKKVPIDLISHWYSLPRNCTSLLQSIIDRYFRSPQLYSRHLSDLQLDTPDLYWAYELLLQTPSHSFPYHQFLKELKLSTDEGEKFLLLLEFNGIAFLHFRHTSTTSAPTPWVSLLGEWVECLALLATPLQAALPETLPHTNPWWFILLMSECIQMLTTQPQAASELRNLSVEHSRAIDKAIELRLVQEKAGQLSVLPTAHEWCQQSFENRSWTLFRHPTNPFLFPKNMPQLRELATERNIREVERSLRRLVGKGWIYMDEVLKTLSLSLGDAQGILLQKHAGRWHYQLPVYSASELEFIRLTIIHRMVEIGAILLGYSNTHSDAPTLCLRITPFGETILGDS